MHKNQHKSGPKT